MIWLTWRHLRAPAITATARHERTQAINQARALIITGPDELRARFAGHTPAALVAQIAAP
jgi:transposase